MATTRKTPSVIVLTEEDLRSFMETVQKGFADLDARLDAIEARMIGEPYPETVRLRKDIAAAALKAATTTAKRRGVKGA